MSAQRFRDADPMLDDCATKLSCCYALLFELLGRRAALDNVARGG